MVGRTTILTSPDCGVVPLVGVDRRSWSVVGEISVKWGITLDVAACSYKAAAFLRQPSGGQDGVTAEFILRKVSGTTCRSNL